MTTLSEASTPTADGELDVPAGWRQGRGAYGGLVIASLVRAIEQRVADPARRVRSVTAELVAPVDAERATIQVDVLREGNNVSIVRASLHQQGELRAHAVAVVASTRRDAIAWQDLRPPNAPAWRNLHPTPMRGAYPEFTHHFEYRLVEGVPLGGGPARTVGWINARDAGPLRDAGYIAAIVDAWWPAALVRFTTMRPMVTVAYTLDIVAGIDGLDPDAPLLYRGTAPVSADGYCLETRELWGEDGRLIAINQQTFAIF
jgi:acyl-CoA thioesterase